MALNEKLDLLNFSDEEKAKAKEKFLATLALVSEEEIIEVRDYLKNPGVVITKARELKVLANPKKEIVQKLSILSEIHEENIYKQDPTKLNMNAIDIYKRIQWCKQNGVTYMKDDGTYESFLFSESAWQKKFNKELVNITELETIKPTEDIVTVEPVIDPIINIADSIEPVSSNLTDHIDIREYMKANDDIVELEAKTTNFAEIRKELEGQLAELDGLKNMSFGDEISFNDLEPETYGMGRAA